VALLRPPRGDALLVGLLQTARQYVGRRRQ
jgi:hypothetical protein